MPKPTQLPEWATDGSADVAPEPSAGKKAVGFLFDERPPVNWINWLFRRLHDWCAYLNLSGSDQLTYANTRTYVRQVQLSLGVNPGGIEIPANTGPTPNYHVIPLILPNQSVLTQVRAGVKRNATGGTGIKLHVQRVNPNLTTPDAETFATMGPPDTSVDNGNDVLVVSINSGSGETIANQISKYYAAFESSVNASSVDAADGVFWLEVTYTTNYATEPG